jgi:hypothetical protein
MYSLQSFRKSLQSFRKSLQSFIKSLQSFIFYKVLDFTKFYNEY